MSWYKMNPIDWNDGTDDLTLEQEAAYLRICHAIYITERPIRANGFVIAGLLRCGERKATRLLEELVEAGKLVIEDGLIANRRALDEVATRSRVSVERKSSGSRGGVASAKARAKALETNEPPQALASTHLKQNRAEQIRAEQPREPQLLERLFEAAGISGFREERHPGLLKIGGIRALIDKGYSLESDVLPVIREKARNRTFNTWDYFVPAIIEAAQAKSAIPQRPAAPAEDWPKRLAVWGETRTWAAAWGPKPGEPGCKAPPELLKAA
jgi:uncharacterized protein YdaU (DUF1376 family)